MSRVQELAVGRQLAEQGELDKAWDIVERLLLGDPNDAMAVVLSTYIMDKAGRLPVAYHLAHRAVALAPERSATWTNLGRCAKDMWLMEEAESSFKKAIMFSENDEVKGGNIANLASILIDTGRFTEAEPILHESLKLSPNSIKAKGNLAFSLLGQGKWEGWEYFTCALGTDWRKKVQYAEEPQWEGEKNKVLAIYPEQGLGDEISFSSMVPDAISDCRKVLLECNPKLEGLFKRSFPEARVYGTRFTDKKKWVKTEKPEASIPIGDLGRFYRLKNEDFPGTPYLKADPERRVMWRALFDSRKKPCIGIAWTGGILKTGARYRDLGLEAFLPVLKSIDAHWVSLQYRDALPEINAFKKIHPDIDIVQYPWATLTPDYDDTAALVSELDCVMCIQTAIGHLCGGLGKECHILIPKNSQWRYQENIESMVWYKSVRLYRQKTLGEWSVPMRKVIDALREKYSERQAA